MFNQEVVFYVLIGGVVCLSRLIYTPTKLIKDNKLDNSGLDLDDILF